MGSLAVLTASRCSNDCYASAVVATSVVFGSRGPAVWASVGPGARQVRGTRPLTAHGLTLARRLPRLAPGAVRVSPVGGRCRRAQRRPDSAAGGRQADRSEETRVG